MCRVLFVVPFVNVPIFGFGVALVAGVLSGTWLAARLAKQDGLDPEAIWDYMLWMLLGGILAARAFYVVQFRNQFRTFWDYFKIWEGGLVFYGSAVGMFLTLAWYCWRRRLPPLRMLDVMAPAFALGLAFGRIGCFLNGCCFGDPGGPWPVAYPAASDATMAEIQKGWRTPFGFGTERGPRPGDPRRVAFLEPDAPAARSELRAGDEILEVQGIQAHTSERYFEAVEAASGKLFGPRATETAVRLTVVRGGQEKEFAVALPQPLPSHPTQLYMSWGNLLLCALLLAYWPLRRRPGETMALMMMGYAVGRFLVEYLRADEMPFADGLTISQNISIPMFLGGLLLWLFAPRNRAAAAANAGESKGRP